MGLGLDALLRYADREFHGDERGRSVNSLALLPLLRSLSLEQVLHEGTYEGYRVWEIALHLAYCKHYFATHAGAGLGAYPFPPGLEGFAAPEDPSAPAFARFLEYLAEVHAAAMEAIGRLEPERRSERLGEWSMSVEDAAVWLCGHDTYHLAQINNMGVPGLRKTKLEF